MASGKTYTDKLLTDVAKGFRPHGHVNEIVLPTKNVRNITGKIANYPADNLRLISAVKGDEAETAVARMREEIGNGWNILKYALKSFASDEQAANEEKPFDVRRDRTEFVMDVLSTFREKNLADFMQNDANFTNTVTLLATDRWDDGGNIFEDINTAVETVSDAIAVPTNQLSVLVSQKVQRQIVKLTSILDALGFKYRNVMTPADVRADQLAVAFQVKEWIVADGHYNAAAEGQADDIQAIWGNGFWVFHRNPERQMKSLPFGHTMRMMGEGGIVVDRWYDNDREGWWIRAKDKWDQYICNETSAYFIKDVFTALPLLP